MTEEKQQQQEEEATTSAMTEELTQAQPRKKRAKIMSACSECRRKKTKCNGEQPCRNCRKSITTASNCVYAANPHVSTRSSIERDNQKLSMALGAIEGRLKSIEGMLRIFAHQQQNTSLEFASNSGVHRLPSIHNLSASLPAQPPQHHLRQLNSNPTATAPLSQQQPNPHLLPPHYTEEEKDNLYYNNKKRKR